MLISFSVLSSAMVVTAVSLRLLRNEVVQLRNSLRAAGAAGVALSEFDREASRMALRVASTKADASDRIRPSRPLHNRTGR